MIIITATDDRYVPGVLALIYSTWVHNDDVKFYVLDNGISSENKKKIQILSAKIHSPITLIDVSDSGISGIELPDDRLTVSAYARLLIPDNFKDHEKVLYLDCDMLVTNSLADLYNKDLGNSVAGVIVDYGPGQKELLQVGISGDTYFNSGLILFNIPEWRKSRITERCFEEVSKTLFLYHDQSALNVVCQGRVTYLPQEYNIFVDVPAERRREAKVKDIKVLHYVGPSKPWLVAKTKPRDPATIYAEIWNIYASSINDLIALPNASDLSREKSFTQFVSECLSDLNRWRKAWMGRMVGKQKYIRRADATKFLNHLLPQIHTRMLNEFREMEKEKQHRNTLKISKDRRADCT